MVAAAEPSAGPTGEDAVGVERIEGDVDALVVGSHAPTQVGPGDQINIGTVITTVLERARRLPRPIVDDDARHLRSRFVEPPGWDRAEDAFTRYGYVLLDGAPGDGRRSAALQLLESHRDGAQEIRELPTEQPEEGSGDILDPEAVNDGDRLLLDMSGCDADRVAALQSELVGYRASLRQRGAALAAVLPHGCRVHDQLAHARVELARPDGATVLRRHLTADGIDAAATARLNSAVAAFVACAPLREIADLARSVRDSLPAPPSETTTEQLERVLDDALDALTQDAERIANQVEELPPSQRPLLLTCALLERAHLHVVHKAETLLRQSVRYPPRDHHELDGPTYPKQLRELAVGIHIGPDLQVTFPVQRRARATRDYFWVNYPGLRSGYRTWVKECVEIRDLALDDRERVAERFAEQCLRIDRPHDVLAVVTSWAARNNTLALAHRAMGRGLLDARHGREFRNALYRWATSTQVSPGLDSLIIALCVELLAPNYPSHAIVRIHQLYDHRQNQPDIADAARTALVHLAQQPRHFRILLARLVDARYHRISTRPGQRLFLDIADPQLLLTQRPSGQPLLTDTVVRQQLGAAWRVVLAADPSDELEARVGSWLRAHAAGGADDLLRVLVDGCDGAVTPLARLLVLARSWLRAPEEPTHLPRRRDTVHRLEELIDSARARRRHHRRQDERH